MTAEAFLHEMDLRGREWYSDDPAWQASHRDADSARAEQRAANEYRERQEKAQQARDLSTQAAKDEKKAIRKSLASEKASEYTEAEKETQKFWDWLTKNDSFYSPHADLVESIRARNEREQREKLAEESSTQAALEEKLAEKGYWNKFAAEEYAKDNETAIGSGALYNEHTGQIYIPASNDNKTGTWEAYSMKGKIHVDPKVERKFSVLSNGLASLMTGGAIVTSKPTARMLQPVIANLIEAGMLSAHYQEQDYVLSNPRTNEVGISVSGAFGPRASVSVGIATDCYGNVGLVVSRSLLTGGGTPGVSLGEYSTWTNAPDINKLGGSSVDVGASIGIPGTPVSVGTDVVGFYCKETGKAYYGFSANGGLSLWPVGVPAEMHGYVEKSTVLSMKELFQRICNQ